MPITRLLCWFRGYLELTLEHTPDLPQYVTASNNISRCTVALTHGKQKSSIRTLLRPIVYAAYSNCSRNLLITQKKLYIKQFSLFGRRTCLMTSKNCLDTLFSLSFKYFYRTITVSKIHNVTIGRRGSAYRWLLLLVCQGLWTALSSLPQVT